MKRYRFRLQSVLMLRRSEQDKALGALLAAGTQVAEQEDVLAAQVAAYDARVARPVAGDAREFRLEQSHRTAMAQAVLDQRLRLQQAREQLTAARETWSAAAVQVGALERLDERQRAEHRAAELKEDDLIADELVVSRHGRQLR